MDVNILVIGYTQEIFAKDKLALMLMKVAKIVENFIYINLKSFMMFLKLDFMNYCVNMSRI